jgi:amino-acid N-acetyltransferase
MKLHRIKELSKVKKLLDEKQLPLDDIGRQNQEFYGYLKGTTIEGIGCLEIYDNEALLRSVAIRHQGQGLGTKLITEIEEIAKEKRIKQLVLLTTTASDFFLKLGYQKINRKDTPDIIKESTEFKDICPDTSIVMQKQL